MSFLSSRKAILLFGFILLILWAAFSAPAQTEITESVIFRTSFSGGDIPSIDPSLVEEPFGIQLMDALTVGLNRLNEETLELDPGMAETFDWNEARDELTFHLREGVPWVRFNPESGEVEKITNCEGEVRTVTAQDFVYGIERTLRPETASSYAFLMNRIVKGAAVYNAGETDDFATVGFRAPDEKTIVVSLAESSAYTLNILSLWMMRAEPRWAIEGDACNDGAAESWTEAGVYPSYGPFALKSWTHNAELTLIRNPFWVGTDAIPVPEMDEIVTLTISETNAIAEYEAGNLDYAIVPFSDYDRLTNDPALADALVEKPLNIGTEAVLFNHLLPPTDDVRVRRALSLAIDREAIVAALKSGTAAPFWIHPNAIGAPDETYAPDFGVKTNAASARALINAYCADHAITPDELTVTYYFSSGDLHQVRAELLEAMWETTLGINVKLENSDWGVFKDVRKQGKHHIYRTAWIQDYLDANNFTADVFLCPGGYYQASTDWPSEGCADLYADPLYTEYERLVTEAAHEPDAAKRAELYARSEKILTRDAAILSPISYNNALYLVNPRFELPLTRSGYDHWEKFGISRSAEP